MNFEEALHEILSLPSPWEIMHVELIKDERLVEVQVRHQGEELHCPECGVSGIEHIISRDSTERSRTRDPWFHVVFCDECGHVYNVLAKHVFSHGQAPRFVIPRG